MKNILLFVFMIVSLSCGRIYRFNNVVGYSNKRYGNVDCYYGVTGGRQKVWIGRRIVKMNGVKYSIISKAENNNRITIEMRPDTGSLRLLLDFKPNHYWMYCNQGDFKEYKFIKNGKKN